MSQYHIHYDLVIHINYENFMKKLFLIISKIWKKKLLLNSIGKQSSNYKYTYAKMLILFLDKKFYDYSGQMYRCTDVPVYRCEWQISLSHCSYIFNVDKHYVYNIVDIPTYTKYWTPRRICSLITMYGYCIYFIM